MVMVMGVVTHAGCFVGGWVILGGHGCELFICIAGTEWRGIGDFKYRISSSIRDQHMLA